MIWVCIILQACERQGKKNRIDSNTSTHVTEGISNNALLLDLFVSQSIEKNNIGILMMKFERDTLEFLSDRKLTWTPFGVNTIPRDIKNEFNPVFKEIDTAVINKMTNEEVKGSMLKSSMSSLFFKRLSKKELEADVNDVEHQDDKPDSTQLYFATIRDTISLAYGLKVGMSKKDFFNVILNQYDSLLLNKINVVINSDPRGEEIDVYFIFKEGILKEIRMKSPFFKE
jgi:hypothetical protein